MPVKSVHYPKFLEKIPSQAGKVVIVTGSTSGTGYHAAKTMLLKGATVVLLNRPSPRVQASTDMMVNECIQGKETDKDDVEKRVVNVECDLQSFASVREAAEKIIELFPNGINILCCNAGITNMPDIQTGDGYDVQMQTNHLSHFLLANLLFESLLKGQQTSGVQSRIVNHSSSARLSPFTLLQKKYLMKPGAPDKLGGNSNNALWGARMSRYHQTKLANSVFTLELAKRIEAAKLTDKIIVLAAHPGYAETDGAKQEGFSINAYGMLPKPQSGEDGALGLLLCMTSSDVKNGSLYGPRFTAGFPTERFHGFLSHLSSGTMLFETSQAATNCTWGSKL